MSRLPREDFTSFGSDLAPGFDISISGTEASTASNFFDAIRPLITGLTFEDDVEMSSLLELTLSNEPQTEPGSPVDWRAVIDSKAFAEGNFIDLSIGYGTNRSFVDRLEIVKWLPTFSPDGVGTFTIKAFDGRHRMAQENAKVKGIKKKSQRKTYYKNLADEQIVTAIAAKYGYLVNIDTTEVKKKAVEQFKGKKLVKTYVIPTRIQAADKSDWEFLQKLAAINYFDLWVDYDRKLESFVVQFRKRADIGQPIYQFTYGSEDGSLLSAEPDFSIKETPTSVEVLHFDRNKRTVEFTEIVEAKSGENVSLLGLRVGPGKLTAKKTLAVGAQVRFSAFGQTVEAFSDRPFKSLKQAANFVQNWLREREQDLLVMQGRVIGLPSLRSRQIHSLRGLGARLDGFYRFNNVKHILTPGSPYVCEFTANKVLSEGLGRRAGQAVARTLGTLGR